MFEDAGVDFPPLPKKRRSDLLTDYEFTLSAVEISDIVTNVLSQCKFDPVEQIRFVMNFRELIETTNKIPIPSGKAFLPEFIANPNGIDD